MFIKFFLFYLLWRITGNPILAIIVLLILFYFLDRRYVGLFPSVTRPIKRKMRISNLHREIQLNPHDMPARLQLAHFYMEGKRYRQALEQLEAISPTMQEEAEAMCDKGICFLALGRLDEGETLITEALKGDDRLRYGEPWLKLATGFANANPEKALVYLNEFQKRNFSSCESWYQLAKLEAHFGDRQASRSALAECLRTYRSLPRFRKRTERRWAILAKFRQVFGR